MTLPRYLQIALVITAGLVAWSQFDDEATPPDERPRPAAPRPPVKPVIPQTVGDTSLVDLFPRPAPVKTAPAPARPVRPVVAPPPSAPPLPFQVLGVWWERQQRIVIVTDGKHTWPVCAACRASDRIWLGSTPVPEWRLTDVTDSHLTFEWQPAGISQRLELNEFTFTTTR